MEIKNISSWFYFGDNTIDIYCGECVSDIMGSDEPMNELDVKNISNGKKCSQCNREFYNE